METPEIISQVAQIMRLRGQWEKGPDQETRIPKAPLVHKDEVNLTETGAHYAQVSGENGNYETEQSMKVERLKALVDGGKYRMDAETVNAVAEKIARMFL